jgi:hypothetical protein
MPTRNGTTGANALRTDLSGPIRSDKAAYRLAIKENGLKTYGKKLNAMTTEQLQRVVTSRISDDFYNREKGEDRDGNKLVKADIYNRLLPEAEEDQQRLAELYSKSSGASRSEAYDTVVGTSKSETGYVRIGNQRFSFQYRVESFVTDDNDEDRNDKIYSDSSIRIDDETIKQA